MPGGVLTKSAPLRQVVKTVLGDNWVVVIEELGAFMAFLAVDGEGEQPITQNARIAVKGRQSLQK